MPEAPTKWKVDTLRIILAANFDYRFAPTPGTEETTWFIGMQNDGYIEGQRARELSDEEQKHTNFVRFEATGREVFLNLKLTDKGKQFIRDYDFQQKAAEHLEKFDVRELLGWDDKTLARWQSQYKPDQAQWILADQEWKRRAGLSSRKIAIAAIAVSIFSVILAALGYLFPKNNQSALGTKEPETPALQSQLPEQPKK